jgi:hypothetical protein
MYTITTQSFNDFVSKIMDNTSKILGPEKLHHFISVNLRASFLVGSIPLLIFIVWPQSRAWFTGYLTILFWFIVVYTVLRVICAIGFALCFYFTKEEKVTKKRTELWINIMALIAAFETILYGFFLLKKQT